MGKVCQVVLAELGAQIGLCPPGAPRSLRPRPRAGGTVPTCEPPTPPAKAPSSAHAPWGIKGGGWGGGGGGGSEEAGRKFAAILSAGTLPKASGRTAWPALLRKSVFSVSLLWAALFSVPHCPHLCPLNRRGFGPRGVGTSLLPLVGACAQPGRPLCPLTASWLPVVLPPVASFSGSIWLRVACGKAEAMAGCFTCGAGKTQTPQALF